MSLIRPKPDAIWSIHGTCVDRLAVFAIQVQIGVSKFETSALKLNTMSTLTAALAKF